MVNLFEEAKDKLESFLGGSVLGDAKKVVADLEAKLKKGEADFKDLEAKVEAKAGEVKTEVVTAVAAAVDAAKATLKKDEPVAVDAVKALLDEILKAVKAKV